MVIVGGYLREGLAELWHPDPDRPSVVASLSPCPARRQHSVAVSQGSDGSLALLVAGGRSPAGAALADAHFLRAGTDFASTPIP